MNPWVQSLVSAAVGGLVGGGVVWSVALRDTDKTAMAAEAVVDTADDGAAAGASGPARREPDDELAIQMASLAGRVGALERKSAAAQQLGEYARALGQQGGAAGAPGDGAPLNPVVDAEDPVFDLAVRSVLDRVDWEKEEERRVERAQRNQIRVQRQVDFITEKLGLTPPQRSKVEEILAKESDAFQQLRNPPDGGQRPVTRRDWRDRIRTIRATTESELGGVLDEKQMSMYREIEEEEGRGFFGRGPR